jgi:hypothetical protein
VGACLLEVIKALKIGALLCIPLKNSFLRFKAKAPTLGELQSFVVLLAVIYGVVGRKIEQLPSVNFVTPILSVVMAMVVVSLKPLKI